MARIPPIAIAATAAVMLVVVLGTDAMLDRTYVLEVQDAQGEWHTVATGPQGDPYFRGGPYYTGGTSITVADNESVSLRVRGDNGYPWAMSESFQVYAQSFLVGQGTLSAEARGSGSVTFEFNASRAADPYAPKPVDARDIVYLELHVDGQYIAGQIHLQEASP